MNKVKFETKQDYLEYCKHNEVVNIRRKYGSQHTNIDFGISERDHYFETGCYVSIEPKSYPCILTWYDDGDNIFGSFIYPNDFND